MSSDHKRQETRLLYNPNLKVLRDKNKNFNNLKIEFDKEDVSCITKWVPLTIELEYGDISLQVAASQYKECPTVGTAKSFIFCVLRDGLTQGPEIKMGDQVIAEKDKGLKLDNNLSVKFGDKPLESTTNSDDWSVTLVLDAVACIRYESFPQEAIEPKRNYKETLAKKQVKGDYTTRSLWAEDRNYRSLCSLLDFMVGARYSKHINYSIIRFCTVNLYCDNAAVLQKFRTAALISQDVMLCVLMCCNLKEIRNDYDAFMIYTERCGSEKSTLPYSSSLFQVPKNALSAHNLPFLHTALSMILAVVKNSSYWNVRMISGDVGMLAAIVKAIKAYCQERKIEAVVGEKDTTDFQFKLADSLEQGGQISEKAMINRSMFSMAFPGLTVAEKDFIQARVISPVRKGSIAEYISKIEVMTLVDAAKLEKMNVFDTIIPVVVTNSLLDTGILQRLVSAMERKPTSNEADQMYSTIATTATTEHSWTNFCDDHPDFDHATKVVEYVKLLHPNLFKSELALEDGEEVVQPSGVKRRRVDSSSDSVDD
uniref:Nucleoprotein n=1 Tax=Beihai dimarhabodovirus 1 TaxID=2116357 RepID=A0A2P1GMR4_9RHAB|nr:nucleoprotein [Beihai dimarhabodovirus 1]